MNKMDNASHSHISEEELRAAERVAARIDAGEELMIPHAVARRVLIDEEPPLRVFREWRGMTLDELATKTGLPHGELRTLDAAAVLPPRRAEVIARALDIPPDLLQN